MLVGVAVVDVVRLRAGLVSGRGSAGWTQEDLAERSGVSVRTIRNFEAGVIARPRLASVRLLLDVLDLPEHEVLGPPAAPLPAVRPAGGSAEGADRLVGRDHELVRLVQIGPRTRILVLTGPCGVGKTRLANEYAARAAASHRRAPVRIPLGALPASATRDQLMTAVRAALAGAVGGDPAGVRGGPLVLVLDNAEHLLLATAEVATELVGDLPNLQVVVTSRRPLPCAAAAHWEVKPLPYYLADAPTGTLPAAVELFLRRAEASCPTLDLSDRLAEVSQLCARLDGIPYALELAAARIRSVSLEAMLRTQPIARLLDSASVDGLPHQRNLASSVRWSYDLLTDHQRGVLHQLGQFAGRFTLEEAERGPLREADHFEVAGALGELVDASLVAVSRGSQYQYRVIGFVRELVTAFYAGLAT